MEVVKLDMEEFRMLVDNASPQELVDLEEELVLALGATEDSIRALSAKVSITDSAAEMGLLTPEEANKEKVDLLKQMSRALAAKNWYREKLSLVRRTIRERGVTRQE